MLVLSLLEVLRSKYSHPLRHLGRLEVECLRLTRVEAIESEMLLPLSRVWELLRTVVIPTSSSTLALLFYLLLQSLEAYDFG